MERNKAILANLIADWVAREPELDVLTFVSIDDDGEFQEQTRSYQQLWDNGQRLASWLQSRGMVQGDSFAVVMQNHAEFVDLMVASSILGTVFVPIDPRSRGEKLRFMLDFAECKGIFVADYALAELEAVAGSGDQRWLATLGPGSGNYDSLDDILAGQLPSPHIDVVSDDAEAPMQLLFTSGTTGDPKGIIANHGRFAQSAAVGPMLGLTREDRPYTGLSLTHANAQVVTLGMILSMGMRGVISRKFTRSRLWDITRQYGCTFFNLLGGMTTAIYAAPPRDDDSDNPVRRILSAGMPAAIWNEFASRFGVELIEFYGAAEGGLTFNLPGMGPVGSCGKPVPSLEMKILDEQDRECATGQAGEICFRNADGSAPVVEYFKNAEASQKKTAGGWLRMGDIGHVDVDGWLFFHYRKGGGIRRNGDFINTAFVEKALSEIDAIGDVYVYGVDLPGMAPGEKEVVAAIVTEGDDFDAGEVFRLCRHKLDAISVPGFLQVLDQIPKTASEKPQERFLLEAFGTDAANVYSVKNFPTTGAGL